jgi:hypothetical protein
MLTTLTGQFISTGSEIGNTTNYFTPSVFKIPKNKQIEINFSNDAF